MNEDTWYAVVPQGILALTLIGLGVTLLREGHRAARFAREGPAWPTVPGEVTKSGLDRNTYWQWHYVSYAPRIRYRYTVDARTYRSARLLASWLPRTSYPAEAEAWVAAYPVGCPLEVHVNPANPGECLVVTGHPGSLTVARNRSFDGGLALVVGLAILGNALSAVWLG